MPRWVQLIGRYGNLALILYFGFLTLYGLIVEGRPFGLALFFAMPAALGAFNFWVIRKAAFLLAEEQWLKGEVRKAELRRKLQEMAEEDAREASSRPPSPPTGG